MSNATFAKSKVNKISINNIVKSDKNALFFNYISFNNSNSSIDIISNINDNDLHINQLFLTDINIQGIISIKNVKANMVDFKGSIINGGLVNPVKFKVKEFANRESALFLKNEAYARNNVIDALEYKAKEVSKYKEELIYKTNKTCKDYLDIISIYLSSLYSNNGQNWGKSFLCTLIIPSLFFAISYISYNISYFLYILFLLFLFVKFQCKDIIKYIYNSIFVYIVFCVFLPIFYLYGLNELLNINFLKELLRFLTPTNFEAIININKNTESYIYQNNNMVGIIIKSFSYFLGKIAFWYGSVQTVQAFRKFSKWE